MAVAIPLIKVGLYRDKSVRHIKRKAKCICIYNIGDKKDAKVGVHQCPHLIAQAFPVKWGMM